MAGGNCINPSREGQNVCHIGIVLVFAAVIGGFPNGEGHMAVLVQPAELLIYCRAATGTLLVANPMHIIKCGCGTGGCDERFAVYQERYLSTLKMMYHS